MKNYYDVWNKQWKEVNENLKSITNRYNFSYSFKEIKDILDEYKNLNLINSSIALEKQFETYNMLKSIDFSKLTGVSEQFKMLSSVELSDILKSAKRITDVNQYFKIPSVTYDVQKMTRIIQDYIVHVDLTQDVSVNEIAEEVVEQYIETTLEDEKKQISSEIQSRQLNKEKIKSEIAFWITIISFVMTIYSFVTSKPLITNNTYNNIVEVNNNYIIDLGVNAEFMNQMGYRIINRNNVMPRIKPNCSSKVTGHLYIGQVVSVSDKYKKWIKITWKNDEGDLCSGWVQNYMVSEFK